MVKEIKIFLNENKLKIVILTVLFSLIAGFGLYYLNMIRSTESMSDQFYVQSKENQPAFFEFYIEDDDGDTFTNSNLIEEFIYSEEVTNDLNENKNIHLEDFLQENFEETGDPDRSKPIYVKRDASSNIHSLVADLDDEELNINVAKYFYDMLKNNSIPFLKNKDIYFISQPNLAKEISTHTADLNKKRIILIPIVSLAFGVIISIGLIIIYYLWKQNISYAFSYDSEAGEDLFICEEKDLNNNDTRAFVLSPLSSTKILVGISKDTYTDYFQNIAKINLETSSDLMDTPSELESADFGILFVYSHITPKKWFNNQKKVLELNNIPYRIIHIHS